MARLTLNDLPDELLEQVATHLHAHDTRRENHHEIKETQLKPATHTYSFCLVSKKFYRIGKPLLYSVFVNDNDAKSLHKFLLRTLRSPESLSTFRAVIIGEFEGPHAALDDKDSEDNQELQAMCWARVQQLDIFRQKERDSWIQSLEKQDHDAQIALLLALSSNIERVDLTSGSFGVDRVYFSWTLRLISWAIQYTPPSGQGGLLSSLRHFVFRESPYSIYPGDQRFWEILMLPFIRKVELHYPTETREGFPYWLERISSVETLVFRPRSLTSRLFESVVRACRVLKSVTYTLGYVGHAERSFDIGGIINALRSHERSLTTLALQCDIPRDRLPAMSLIPPLKDFAKLRRLHISGTFVLSYLQERRGNKPITIEALLHQDGASAYLPRSLEFLSIDCVGVDQSDWGDFVTLLSSIGKLRDEHFPHLETLEAIVPSMMWEGCYDGLDQTTSLASIASAIVDSSGIIHFSVCVSLDAPLQGTFRTHNFMKESSSSDSR